MTTAASSPVIKIQVDTSAIPGAVNNANAQLARIGQGNGATGATGAISQLTMSLGGAGSAATRTAANSNVASSAFGSLGASAQAAMGRLAGMGGSLTGLAFAGAALGATAVVGGLVALGTAAVAASAKMEGYRASLTTILGDSDKAAMAMDRLAMFAAKTPFSLDQAVTGFTKLKALGLQPTEAAMTSYGNTASALGKDLNQMVEAVADAATGEFERLKEFGIKSSKQGDDVAFTFQGVTKKVKNNSDEIQKYLLAIGNVNFAGAMDKQAKTFNGAMSNLEDTWTQTMAKVGDGGLMTAMGGVIRMITDGISGVTPVLVSLGNLMGGLINGVVSVASGFGNMFAGIVSNGGTGLTFIETLTLAINVVGQTAEVVGSVIGAAFSAVGQVISGIVGVIRNVFASFWDWLGVTSAVTSSNMGTSFLGALRAAKFVAQNLQTIFSTALGAIGGAFSIVGKRILDFLAGNWNAFDGMGGALKGQFQAAGQVLNGIAVKADKIAKDQKGAAAAWGRLTGRTSKKGGLSLDDLAGAAPKPTPAAGKGDKADKGAKAAADRAKRENDFWQTLKDQTTAAGMLTLQAEQYNKGLELRKILDRDLTTSETARVATSLGELNTAKALTSLRQRANDAANEYTVELQRGKGLTDAQKSVEDELYKFRLDALNKGVDINSIAYKAAEGDLRTQLDKNAALKEQNSLLAKAGDFAKKFSSAFDITSQLREMAKERDAFVSAWNENGGVIDGQTVSKNLFDSIIAGYDLARDELKGKPLLEALGTAANGSLSARSALDRTNATTDFNKQKAALAGAGLSPEQTDRALKEITANYKERMLQANRLVGDDFVDRLTDGISEIGQLFGGVIGEFADKLSDVIQSMKGNANGTSGTAQLMSLVSSKLGDGFKESSASMLDIGKGFKSLGDPLKSLKEGFSGKNGSIVKGIGSAVGGAMAGAQMGSMIGDFGKMLGANAGFQKGSKIGGTIGGLTGNPVIAAGASVIGGLIGSLFSKPKQASAGLSVVDGVAVGGKASGNGKAALSTATALAGNVASGINSIATQLGATIGTLAGVSVGYRPGHKAGAYRVDTTGGGKLTGVAAFETEAEAIAFAIKDAIADGALTGLDDIINKALKSMDIDSALAFAGQWKDFTAEFDAMKDPIGAAVRSVITPLDSLRDTMVKLGANSTDLAKVEEYRSATLKDLLKEQLSSLNDFKKALSGDGSGVSALDQLNANLAEFKSFQDRIAAGDSSVDQSAFTSLGQQILSGAGDVYGTSGPVFQGIRSMLLGVTDAFMTNVTTSFNAANANASVEAAIGAQTSAVVSQAVITNNLLTQLVAGQNAANNNAPVNPNGLAAKNGQLVNREALY